MQPSNPREKVRFRSGGTECVAWHYPGANGACVVMAGGFAVTKEPGTDRFAGRFHQAGFTVLVLACDQDRSALADPAVRAARRAPRGELVRLPGGHYEPFMGGFERAVEAQPSFLHRRLVERSSTRRASTAAP